MRTLITVRELRKLIGESQGEFAVRLGVSQSQVSRWESGEQGVSEDNEFKVQALYEAYVGGRDLPTWAIRPSVVSLDGDDGLMNSNIQPTHYQSSNGQDKFDQWYYEYPFEPFRAVMECIAERYLKRRKSNRIEDLEKARYTIERLIEYEKKEASNESV